MAVVKRPFGVTSYGKDVTEFIITNDSGCSVSLIDYGATVRCLRVPDKNGVPTDVVLGYDSVEEYEQNTCFMGATIGRNANRIAGARFQLGLMEYILEANEGKNQLHGGKNGFDRRMWHGSCLGDGVCFYRLSPDGEEGFPGNVEVSVLYRLTPAGALEINYCAESDQDTICNLTNHSYFNLDGHGQILDHRLQIFAGEYTENNSECYPTGAIAPVSGTPLDFTDSKPIGRDIFSDFEQLNMFKGYDHNFVLRGGFSMKCAAILKSELSGIEMTVYTDRPGLQLYTGNSIYAHPGKNGSQYGPYSALCLESQFFPNALSFSHFATPILRKDEYFRSVTIYEFSAG